MINLQIKKLCTLDTVYTLDLLSTKCSKLLQEAKKLSNFGTLQKPIITVTVGDTEAVLSIARTHKQTSYLQSDAQQCLPHKHKIHTRLINDRTNLVV